MANNYIKADEQDESLIDQNKVSDWRSLLILLRYARPYRFSFLICFLLLALGPTMAVSSGRILGYLVERGLTSSESSLWPWVLLILFLEGLAVLVNWQARKKLSFYASKSVFDMRSEIFEHLQFLPLSFYDRQPQGRIITRATHDVEGVENFFTSGLGMLLSAVISACVAGVAMILTSWRLGVPMVLAMMPTLLLLYLTKNSVRVLGRKSSKASGLINSKLSEFISGLPVIRAFALEDWTKKVHDSLLNDHLAIILQSNIFYAWSRPLAALFCALPLVMLLSLGGFQVLEGTMSLGLFVAFVRYYDRFMNPVMVLARELHTIQEAFTSAERVAAFLKHPLEDEELGANGKLTLAELSGDITFDHLSMSYGKGHALFDVSFHIKAGEKIGLVGRTGCGKSTTVSLLARLYAYQEGAILIDGHSLEKFDRQWWRSQLGFVSQDVVIFRGSLKDNLSTGANISLQLILNSCHETGLLALMSDKGLTLDSELFEGGANLSVGERQLVALTRILILGPKILIMDEATANIDAYYEELIHKAVKKVMKGRTCLFIAHRLSTLLDCDRLFVFDHGRLIESGTQAELLSKEGHFYKLVKAQETSQ